MTMATHMYESGRAFFRCVFIDIPEDDYQPPILRLLGQMGLATSLFAWGKFSGAAWMWVAAWFIAGISTYKVIWYEFLLHANGYRGPRFALARGLLENEYRDKGWLRLGRWIAATAAMTFLVLAHVGTPLPFLVIMGAVTVTVCPVVAYFEWCLLRRFSHMLRRRCSGA